MEKLENETSPVNTDAPSWVKYAYLIFDVGFPFKSAPNSVPFGNNTELKHESVKEHLRDAELEYWMKWIGSAQFEDLQEQENIISTWANSSTPEILNREDTDLQRKVNNIFRVLPLLAPIMPSSRNCYICSGKAELQNGKLKIIDLRSFKQIHTWRKPFYIDHQWGEYSEWAARTILFPDFFKEWQLYALKFEEVLGNEKKYVQIEESFRSFNEAINASQLEFKIPNLIRSIECIVHCFGSKQFASKVLYLTGPLPSDLPHSVGIDTQNLLEELYQMRNDCSHGKPFAHSFTNKYGRSASGLDVSKYEFLAEWIARKILKESFINQTILDAATDRKKLEQSWDNNQIVRL